MGARPRAKHLEQGHIADHVFERVSSAYADFRLTAHRAARKRHLRIAAPAEEGSAAKRQAAGGEAGEALTEAAAAPPTATAAEGLVAPAVCKVEEGQGSGIFSQQVHRCSWQLWP